jgi:hypothetical protein
MTLRTDNPMPAMRFRLTWPARKGREFVPTMQQVTDVQGPYEFEGTLYAGIYTLSPDAGYAGEPMSVELTDGGGPWKRHFDFADRARSLPRSGHGAGGPWTASTCLRSRSATLAPTG